MTTGQRIAAKRRELDLSQEGLGEALGVSRQSIYKWESDSSLPDVDKLVALSRLFHVSVGWLLGVEEDQEEHISNDLSPAQLKLVEEILSRYQQSSQLTAEQQERVSELVEQKVRESRSPRHRRLRYGAACLAPAACPSGRALPIRPVEGAGPPIHRPGQFRGQYYLLGQ